MSTETADQHAITTGRTFVWHEVYVPDAGAAIDFYTQALDFGTQEFDMGPMGTYKMLTKDGKGVAGVMSTTEMEMPDVPAQWSTYIGVDNVDASLEKCLALGAKVVVPTMDVPTVGRMVLIQDPQGAHVWLFTPQMPA